MIISPVITRTGRQVAQSVERWTLEAEVLESKPVLGTWWWGRIPPNQPYPKGSAPAATTLLAEWWPLIPQKGVIILKKKSLGPEDREFKTINVHGIGAKERWKTNNVLQRFS